MIIYYNHSYSGKKGESHDLLAKAIALQTGHDQIASQLLASMRTTEKGKPFIDAFEKFSISHSNNTWAVLMDQSDCGLDIQYYRTCDTKGIAQRFYAAEDAARICSAKSEAGSIAEFFRIWARREALVKAVGVSVADSDLPSVLSDDVTYCGREWKIKDIRIPDTEDASAAVCFCASDPEVFVITITEINS